MFFEFFQYVEERTQNLNNARQQRHRNVQVNRSVISQQAALTTTNRVTINETNAPANRERGTGEIAGSVTINETTDTTRASSHISSDSSTNQQTITHGNNSTPRRRTAPNDGRSSRNQRSRHFNVPFSPTLPPSTSGARSINIHRLEDGYAQIAESINQLAYNQRIRTTNIINQDIMRQVETRSALIATGGDPAIIESMNKTIADLITERQLARNYQSYVASRVDEMITRNNINSDINAEEKESEDNTDE